MGEIYLHKNQSIINYQMTLVELLTSMTISSILLSATTKLVFELNKQINQKIANATENSEVQHALHIMTRSIRNAGFTSVDSQFPKMANKESRTKALGIAMRKSSALNNSKIGDFIYRKGINNVNQSDALYIKHSSYGHFDCLGHKITPKRLINGHAYLGFFAQRVDSNNAKTGTLMCQSIDNKGRAQNDGILSGMSSIHFELIPNDTNPKAVQIFLNMDSGKKYSRFVALRNKVAFN